MGEDILLKNTICEKMRIKIMKGIWVLGFTPYTHNRILLAMEERANNQENCIDQNKKITKIR